MLSLIHRHLKHSNGSLLFLVLPLACVTNSRYLTVSSLRDLMNAVGFDLVNERCRERGKVGYWLWSWKRPGEDIEPWRRRRIISDGPKRNNFSIVLP
jgi:25S rRNA (adenine2142-N1)-methyltransferase